MKVFQAIHEVMTTMSKEGIGKGRKNQQQGYQFRGIDDVLNNLSAAMCEAGLLCVPRVLERTQVERSTSKGGALFYTTVKVDFDLIAKEDGSKHTVTTYGEAMDSADKSTNKAMSAAYKYMALLTFCIPTEATPDNDADFTTHDVEGKGKGKGKQRGNASEPVFDDAVIDAHEAAIREATDEAGVKVAANAAIKDATEAGRQDWADEFARQCEARLAEFAPA